jgi:hypothetical protein
MSRALEEVTMTTRTLVLGSAIALVLIAATGRTLCAQTTVDAELVPFVGGSFFRPDARAPLVISRQAGAQLTVQDGELRNAPAYGFSAGLRLADRFGVEGIFAWAPTRLVGSASLPQKRRVADVNTMRYGVTALHHWDEWARVRPFAGVAVSGETLSYEPYATWERETNTAAGITAGAHLPVSDRIALRVQALQDLIGSSEPTRRAQLLLMFGLSYRERIR